MVAHACVCPCDCNDLIMAIILFLTMTSFVQSNNPANMDEWKQLKLDHHHLLMEIYQVLVAMLRIAAGMQLAMKTYTIHNSAADVGLI